MSILQVKNLDKVKNDIQNLDLSLIKGKLLHSIEGLGWSEQKVNSVELQYKTFLYLCYSNIGKTLVPTKDIDTFWHYHILDTRKYADDCEKIFGYFLHHFPYLGLRGEVDKNNWIDLFEKTKELFSGATIIMNVAPACCGGGNIPACCGGGNTSNFGAYDN